MPETPEEAAAAIRYLLANDHRGEGYGFTMRYEPVPTGVKPGGPGAYGYGIGQFDPSVAPPAPSFWENLLKNIGAAINVLGKSPYDTASDVARKAYQDPLPVQNIGPFETAPSRETMVSIGNSPRGEASGPLPPTPAPSPLALDPAGLRSDPLAVIRHHESGSDYNAGYSGGDISKYPPRAGYNGFPDWPGEQGPQGTTHAAGAYQFEPETWKRYAAPLGINDFSKASQDKVAKAAYNAEGFAPWAPYNPRLARAVGWQGGKSGSPMQLALLGSGGPDLAGLLAAAHQPRTLSETVAAPPTPFAAPTSVAAPVPPAAPPPQPQQSAPRRLHTGGIRGVLHGPMGNMGAAYQRALNAILAQRSANPFG